MRGGFSMERVVATLALAGLGGCATAGASARPTAGTSVAPEQTAAGHWRRIQDSVTAQSIADERGPRVSVHVNFRTIGGLRRVDAGFRMRDDAYVLVAHVDADGHLTVVFPKTPQDDGFVEGGRNYQVPEFNAGFQNNYAFARYSGNVRYRPYSSRVDSYDGGTGYVFVVASWRPMQFDRIVENGHWASYELSDAFSTSDPRDEVDEFAALIAGDSREAYSVEYATYYRSNYSPDLGSYAFNSYDCAGYSGLDSYYGGVPGYGFGFFPSLYAIGSGWFYLPISDPVTGCRSYTLAYLPSTLSQGYVNWPAAGTGTTRGKMVPIGPRDTNVVVATQGGSGVGGGTNTLRMMRATELRPLDANAPQPDYRARGLLTSADAHENPRSPAVTGAGRADPSLRFDQPRPGITDMVLRSRDRGDAGNREPRVDTRARWSSPSGMPVMREPASVSRSPRTENGSAPRMAPAYSPPRSAPRAAEPRPTPRASEPASSPRMQAPSSPRPAASAPSSPRAAEPSSKPNH